MKSIEPSGAHWCARFPGSASTDDLAEPFRSRAKFFIDELRAAGASVIISATLRPAERAYLMHWCCLVAGYQDQEKVSHHIAPADVPPMDGVDIDWTCGGDGISARGAAAAMVKGYGISYPAALKTQHAKGLAIDMTVSWKGIIHVTDKRGVDRACSLQHDLWPVGATYGVFKLPADPPHWSVDGH